MRLFLKFVDCLTPNILQKDDPLLDLIFPIVSVCLLQPFIINRLCYIIVSMEQERVNTVIMFYSQSQKSVSCRFSDFIEPCLLTSFLGLTVVGFCLARSLLLLFRCTGYFLN
uniref:ORF72 n=1 Tax=Malaco herpesvirus 1 TaxID=3031797 RepID=A0AA48P7T3_9VIRU|nr:TPA_asm: ORF72 [Malaco herpesvirus 1]